MIRMKTIWLRCFYRNMLEKYRHFQNLWTPQFFTELFQLFEDGSWWNREDLGAHFRNRMMGSYTLFEWGVEFAIGLWFIFSNEGKYFKSPLLDGRKPETTESIREIFLREMISNPSLKDDIMDIIRSEFISFNTSEKCFVISNDAFGFSYANFKHMLLDFGFLLPSTAHAFKYRIETDFKNILSGNGIFEESRRRIWIEELKRKLEANEKNGLMAECFVMEYESRRLHWKRVPIRISEIDVCAWYDILSYDNPESKDFDRFIEVKSFVWHPWFYWSRNEVERARSLRSRYCLYLVDRNKLNTSDYVPVMISNPYEAVLENGHSWTASPDWFHVLQLL